MDGALVVEYSWQLVVGGTVLVGTEAGKAVGAGRPGWVDGIAEVEPRIVEDEALTHTEDAEQSVDQVQTWCDQVV